MSKKTANIICSIIISWFLVISLVYFEILWWAREDYTAGLRIDYINIKTILLFLVFACLSYIFLEKIENKIGYLKITVDDNENVKSSKKFFLCSLICNLIVWGIWFVVLAPGAGMNDTLNALMSEYSTANCPIVYQMLLWYGIKIMKIFSDSMTWCYGCLVVLQMFACACVFASVIRWLAEKRLKKNVLYVLIAYYSFMPVVADYSITLVKDTLYAVVLLKFIIMLYDIVDSKGEFLKKHINFLKMLLISIGVCCFRSNGAAVCIVSLMIALCVMVKNRKKSLLLMLVLIIAVNTGIGHFEQVRFNSDIKLREASGVLFAQIGAVLNDPNAKIEEKNLERLNELLPIEVWKENYRPSFADLVKFNQSFNNDWLNENKVTFLEIWFKLMLDNFPTYVKAYVCHSYGYWGVLPYPPDMSQSYFTSVNNNTGDDSVWGMFCQENNLRNQSILPQQASETMKKVFEIAIRGNFLITPGLMILMVFVCVTILWGKKMYFNCIPCLPVVFTWGTMMIASPASLIYRYSYYLVLAVPVIIIMTVAQYKNALETR